MATATYVPIATQTLSTAASSITFSSIPSTYTDLRVVFTGTNSVVTDFFYLFNNDNGANYSSTDIHGNGSAAGSTSLTGESNVDVNAAIGEGSLTIPQMFTLDIFSYAGSTYKTSLYTWSGDQNGGTYSAVARGVSLWRSTAAINSIKLYFASGTLLAGTTATLWGI